MMAPVSIRNLLVMDASSCHDGDSCSTQAPLPEHFPNNMPDQISTAFLRLMTVFVILHDEAKAVQDHSTVQPTPRECFRMAGRKRV